MKIQKIMVAALAISMTFSTFSTFSSKVYAEDISTLQPISAQIEVPLYTVVPYSITGFGSGTAKITITGETPKFVKMKNEEMQNKLNAQLEAIYTAKLTEAKKLSNPTLNMKYEVKESQNYFSVLITSAISNGNTSSEDVTSIVLDKGDYKQYTTLKSLPIENINATADKVINDAIKAAPEGTYTLEGGFKGTNDSTKFYVNEKGNAVVYFNKYEIASGATGSPKFEIEATKNVKTAQVKSIKLNTEANIKGTLPQFANLPSQEFQNKLNNEIGNFYDSQVAQGNKIESTEMNFSYEVYSSDKYVSVVIKASIASDNTGVDKSFTIVVDKEMTTQYTSLVDILGKNAYSIADRTINATIKATPDNYIIGEGGFAGTNENTKFYTNTSGNAVVVFDKYEIASGSIGMPTFEIKVTANPEVVGKKIVSETVNGTIPQFKNIVNEDLATQLDKLIGEFYENQVASGDKTDFDYEVKTSENFVSVIMRAYASKGNTGNEQFLIFVLNKEMDTLYKTLTDVLGKDAKKIADTKINAAIKAAPEGTYFTGKDGFKAFSGVTDASLFYIDEKGNVVVMMNKYEIAPGYVGSPKFVVATVQNIASEIKLKDTKLSGKVVVFPLRTVVEGLGYSLEWNNKTMTIAKYNESHTMAIGKKTVDNGVTVDSAPIMIGTTTYVTASFLKNVLDIDSTFDNDTFAFTIK